MTSPPSRSEGAGGGRDEGLDCRQGDVALDASEFVHVRLAASRDPAGDTESEGLFDAIPTEVRGLVVLTQTCELIRPASERPFAEVAPLVQSLDDVEYHQVERGLRTRYAVLPALEEGRLVADLDRVMTMEKGDLRRFAFTRGLLTAEDERRFRQALARKRTRTPYPDDFVRVAADFQKRLKEKHDRRSAEGVALTSLREIRVSAFPGWEAERIEVYFWFVTKEDGNPDPGLEPQIRKWMALLHSAGRYAGFQHRLVSLTDMSARDYVYSDPLDLDYLTTRACPPR